eukprot:symbB.v1.2.020451.t1/scaffold1720.1/size104783/5
MWPQDAVQKHGSCGEHLCDTLPWREGQIVLNCPRGAARRRSFRILVVEIDILPHHWSDGWTFRTWRCWFVRACDLPISRPCCAPAGGYATWLDRKRSGDISVTVAGDLPPICICSDLPRSAFGTAMAGFPKLAIELLYLH